MSVTIDPKIAKIDADIALLREERKKQVNELADPVRARIKEIYTEIACKFDELHELGDDTWMYGDYDQESPVSFQGKFFSYTDGNIEEN